MKTGGAGWLVIAALVFGVSGTRAIELHGRVIEASGGTAKIALDSDLVPLPGDKATIFFVTPGSGEEIMVGSGSVSKMSGDSVSVKIEDATGDVAKNQLARITSDNPQHPSSRIHSGNAQPRRGGAIDILIGKWEGALKFAEGKPEKMTVSISRQGDKYLVGLGSRRRQTGGEREHVRRCAERTKWLFSASGNDLRVEIIASGRAGLEHIGKEAFGGTFHRRQ
jgi:hypothetical protein